jgi:hypothetical protein
MHLQHFGNLILHDILRRHVSLGILIPYHAPSPLARSTETRHTLIVRHLRATPQQAPVSGPKTGPQTVRGHSAPSPFVAPIWVQKADLILEPKTKIL